MKLRRTTLPVLALLAGTALWTGTAGTASAHVTVLGTSQAAGSYTTLTFAFSHGCEDSPTTGLTVQLPEGVDAAAPGLEPGWEVEKVMTELDPPATDSHGNQLTERVSEIRWTADTPVPNGYLESFDVSLQLPADAAGSTLAFPAVQTCEDGENAWVQLAADGQDPDALDSPAPTLEVLEAGDGSGHSHGSSGTDETGSEESGAGGTGAGGTGAGGTGAGSVAASADEATAAAPSGGSGLGVGLGAAGLVAGLAGLAVGLTALVRGARKRA